MWRLPCRTTALSRVSMSLQGAMAGCEVLDRLCCRHCAGRTLRGMVQKPTVMTQWGPLGRVPAYAR